MVAGSSAAYGIATLFKQGLGPGGILAIVMSGVTIGAIVLLLILKLFFKKDKNTSTSIENLLNKLDDIEEDFKALSS